MTKFVVDASAVLHLVGADARVAAGRKLLAPTLLRSQTLSLLHEAVQRGDLSADHASERLARVGRMPIASWATPSSGGAPGTSPVAWGGPRPTTPSTSRSPSSRPTRS